MNDLNNELGRSVRKARETQVICTDEPGAGGACHRYLVVPVAERQEEAGSSPFVMVVFQEGPIKENGINGAQNEDLLAIVIDRLEGFQGGNFPCKENEAALDMVRGALSMLEKRTNDRISRGVEGKSEQ